MTQNLQLCFLRSWVCRDWRLQRALFMQNNMLEICREGQLYPGVGAWRLNWRLPPDTAGFDLLLQMWYGFTTKVCRMANRRHCWAAFPPIMHHRNIWSQGKGNFTLDIRDYFSFASLCWINRSFTTRYIAQSTVNDLSKNWLPTF